MKTSSRVPLREIAKQAGLTRMAASLALRNRPGVSAATRKKVLAIAQRMGYEPDPEVAKLLSRIRANTPAESKSCLALLTSGTRHEEWKISITERKYVEGATKRARDYGYRVEEFWRNEPGMTADRLSNILWNRGIEGIIIAPLQGKLAGPETRAIQMDLSRFSVVEISETVESPDLDRAIHDQYSSMLTLLHELLALGYLKIGLVLEEALDARVNGKWTAAYLLHAHRQHKRNFPPPLILSTLDHKIFARWFERYRPDALISVDRLGLRLLKEHGLKIPKDIGYATLDLDGDRTDYPDLGGIDQNSLLVGAAAVDMLVAAIQRAHRGIPDHPVRTEVEGSWVMGSSLMVRRCASTLRK